MITKNQIKLIASLQQKKIRTVEKLFVAEGEKVIRELLESKFELVQIYATDDVFEEIDAKSRTLICVGDLKKISALTSANNCLAVFRYCQEKSIFNDGLTLVLDDIRDPGNLGTIIRLCDWFGVSQLVCSLETVDFYNPKVVQATMGSLTRVNINYCDLEQFIKNSEMPVFGTFMDGQNVYETHLPKSGLLILGNEANGISQKIEHLVGQKLSIPRFGDFQKTESLNVAAAAAVFLSEFMRS